MFRNSFRQYLRRHASAFKALKERTVRSLVTRLVIIIIDDSEYGDGTIIVNIKLVFFIIIITTSI